MRHYIAAAAVTLAAAGPALAAGHGATVTGYALADDGRTLVVMPDLSAPAEGMARPLDRPLAAIAWRPVTGTLLGLGPTAIYRIDPESGATTDLGATFMPDARIAEGAMVALDFNNQIDAVRAVSVAGDNLVYFPAGFGGGDDRAGTMRRFADLAYAPGDAHAGAVPMVFANAYTNAIPGSTAGNTFQYALDAETNALVSLANNAGTLETIAAITIDGSPVDIAPLGGFDIVSPAEGQDMAHAILQLDGAATAGLYAIDLDTGAATLVADLGRGGFTGLATSLGM